VTATDRVEFGKVQRVMQPVGPVRTFDDLLNLARRFEDEPIETVTGRLFTVRVFRQRELVFTPLSSGLGQSDGRRAQERFLARFMATRSLRPSDYADVTRNASYLVALLIAGQATERPVGMDVRQRRAR
jgi:hypothetical protein